MKLFERISHVKWQGSQNLVQTKEWRCIWNFEFNPEVTSLEEYKIQGHFAENGVEPTGWMDLTNSISLDSKSFAFKLSDKSPWNLLGKVSKIDNDKVVHIRVLYGENEDIVQRITFKPYESPISKESNESNSVEKALNDSSRSWLNMTVNPHGVVNEENKENFFTKIWNKITFWFKENII